jgi:hypothetical protein
VLAAIAGVGSGSFSSSWRTATPSTPTGLTGWAFRQSFPTVQSGDAAYVASIIFYLACVAATWHLSGRRPS